MISLLCFPTLSTNRAIYAGTQTVRVRALLLTTSLKPYEGIADLYLIDPDGYVIRKWNSMEMNVGVLLQDFDLPDYPKVRRTLDFTCFLNPT